MTSSPDSACRWSARSAWLCAAVIALLEIVVDVALTLSSRNIHALKRWLTDDPLLAKGILRVLRAALWLFVAYFFSRPASIRLFIERTGLRQGPTLFGWGVAWVAVGIGILNVYGATRGLTSPTMGIRAFSGGGPAPLLFYVVFVIVAAPFFEEVVMRGFMYRAFRATYGRFFSAASVICVAAYFHSSVLSPSLYTLSCLISLWILLCAVQEKTWCVWNCIVCHGMYNATVTMKWPICAALMILLLPACACGTRSACAPIQGVEDLGKNSLHAEKHETP